MNTMLTNKYVSALGKRYEAQIAEAEANLALYLSGQNLAAIGEHSDLMEEQDRWISKLAEAKDKLETLKSLQFEDSNIYKSINS
jgi:hypothetical protein